MGPDAHRAVLIVGTGDHARVVNELIVSAGLPVSGMVEPSDTGPLPERVDGVDVIGRLAEHGRWSAEQRGARFVVAIGNGRAREQVFRQCRALGLEPLAVIHPAARLLRGATVLPGSQICAGAIVGVAALVGHNAIVNTGATVDHDNEIGDHATIGPGAHLAGRVSVGSGAHVGIGAVVREGIRIGDWAFVAAGAAVVRDVPPGVRVAGVPARPMSEAGAAEAVAGKAER